MLFETYTMLVQGFPISCVHLYGRSVSAVGDLWLSIDAQALPCLLFPSNDFDERNDIRLRFIDVEFSRSCEIATEGAEPVSGTYTIVRLNEDDPEIVRVFLRLLEEEFCRPEDRFSNRQISDRILELANLFSKIENSTGDILGLWGELCLISKSGNVPGAVRCWCLHKNAKYDFVSSEFVLEVKATLRVTRQHRFSLDQLRPEGEFDAYVASLQLVETHSGKTVSELLEEIHDAIPDTDLQSAFFRLCLIKGGKDIYRSSLRLQELPDNSSLAIFDAQEIPVPRIDPSAPVTNVRFDVDLSAVPKVDAALLPSLLAFPDDKSYGSEA
jgi:hypothetical protein